MKAVFNRVKLAEAFGIAARFAPSRSPVAALQNVKLTVSDVATLEATNTEVGVRVELEGVDVEKPGSVLLPVSTVSGMFRDCRDESLRIVAAKNKITIQGERTTVNLAAIDPDEFSGVPQFAAETFSTVPAALLKSALSRTLSAAGEVDSRYTLNGVKLELSGQMLSAVSSDGRRLIALEGPATIPDGCENNNSIIPYDSAKRIAAAIEAIGDVHVAVQPNDVLLRTATATFYARLLEGRFPIWRDYLGRRDDESHIDVPAGQLASLVRAAAIVSNAETNGVDLTFGRGTLAASMAVQGVGDSQSEIAIAYDGEKFVVRLDYRFVLDFVAPLTSEQAVTIRAVGEEDTVVLEADGGAYRTVIMPMVRS